MNNSAFQCRRSIVSVSLAILFLLFGTGSLKAQLTLRANEPTVAQVINAAKTQSNVQFFYDSELSGMKVNSVSVTNVPLSTLLEQAFAGKGIAYKIEDNICYLSVVQQPAVTSASSSPLSARTVTGRVTDSKGMPLIGVAVTVQGTTVGTATDADGRYSLNVPATAETLSFSYMGYTTTSVAIGSRTVIDMTMDESAVIVDDVVVTALGIKRETKALTYNVQAIATEDILTVRDANMMNSLSGKIAGVTIQQSSSGVGGSTRVVMRGTKSLFGDNNALYVLDGIPLLSLKSEQSDNFYEAGEQGDSEGIAMINPDDIESMSVLTGSAASALYGNRGANGVVLITSKKGAAGKTRVRYSNNTSFSSPFVMPKFQNTYGRFGETYSSWGNKLDKPSSYDPRDFFQTGANTMNSVGVSAGNENHQLYASVGAVNARGMVPNTKYNRYNFTARTSSQLIQKQKDRLTLDITANYMEQNDQNSIGQGMYYNPLVAIYLFPPGDDINRFVPYEIWNSERNFKTQNWSYETESLDGLKQNPFWIINRNMFNNKRQRTILTGALNWKIADWITASGRVRMDSANSTYERRLYASSNKLFAKSDMGNFSRYNQTNKNIYADFLFNIDKTFGYDYRLTANVGGSFNDERYRYEGYDGPLATVVNFFHIGNMKDLEHKKDQSWHTRTNSLYATAQLGYKAFLYLDLSARTDFFSTMVRMDRVYEVYPSVGLSAVLTEVLPIPRDIVPFWKIRGSYSHVGNPIEAYKDISYISIENGVINNDATYINNALRPEKTKSFEIGTDLKLWKNKINIAFTYYNSDTYNQLFSYDMAPSTGYKNTYVNGGRVNNRGIELSVDFNQNIGPVDWNLGVTYSRNRNEIKELLPQTIRDPYSGASTLSPEEVIVAGAGGYRMILKEGGSMGDIYVTSFKRDGTGHIYVNPSTGRFEVDNDNFIKIGSAMPKYNLGVRNNFHWNGISLGVFIDARVGGVVVSSTQALLDQYGVSKATADARDQGGVYINNGQMDAKTYYEITAAGNTGAAMSEYTYSATNVRLRELTIGYSLPKKWFRDKLDISVSLYGRNLFMFYNKAPFDPELTANTGTYYQGYDYCMPPSQRTLGFGVNVSF